MGVLRKGEYRDSVPLMKLAEKLRALPGVKDSAAVMGSRENLSILEAAGLLCDPLREARDNDLIIALGADCAENAERAMREIDNILSAMKTPAGKTRERRPRTIVDALIAQPDSILALISVAGKFAGHEAMTALRSGLHVMLFSDNVPLETEIELKKFASERGLLVMGPDCGTAIINGVPLGFANAVRRGDIGIVAASGTGLQEVSCIISNEGCGISQAIGTGSRDIKSDVGGVMFIQALRALAGDPDTRVVLLVSKPPDRDVLEKITSSLDGIFKAVVAVFLGAEPGTLSTPGMVSAMTLEEGALMAVILSKGESPEAVTRRLQERDDRLALIAKSESAKLAPGQRYLRGLFSGGTFCYEAQVLLKETLRDVYSNSPFGDNHWLKNPHKSEKHTLVDMGADEFTVGRLHPMIDFSLRARRIAQEAAEPETAALLLDIVLGFGANPDPLIKLAPAIEEARALAKDSGRHLPIIASVTGTDNDPQNRAAVIRGLTELGVIAAESNAAASKLAGLIVSKAEGIL